MPELFNCDETRLYWKLRLRTLASSHEKAAKGFKKPKEHITFMAIKSSLFFCFFPSQIICTCFKNVDNNDLQVDYYTHRVPGWIPPSSTEQNFFPRCRKALEDYVFLKKLCIILLHNAPCHPDVDSTDGRIF